MIPPPAPAQLLPERPIAASEPAPAYRLYPPGAITAATVLGSPLAGAVLLARNERRRGARGRALAILALGLGWTALLVTVAILANKDFTRLLVLVSDAVIHFAARYYQRPFFEAHLRTGGRLASGWSTAGVTLATVLVLLAVGGSAVYLFDPPWGRELKVDHLEVYYADGATRDQASRLAGALLTAGIHIAVVQVRPSGESYLLTFSVKTEALQDQHIAKLLGEFARMASRNVFDGKPVEIRLCDDGDFDDAKRLPAAPEPSPAVSPSPAATPRPPIDEKLPEELTKAAIVAAMAKMRDGVTDCYERYRIPGSVQVAITVGGDGAVQSATVQGRFAGKPTGDCIERAIRAARFPRFRAPSMSFVYPFILR